MSIKNQTSKNSKKRGLYRKCPNDVTINAYIPANFDFDAHILLWPLPERVTKDKVHYFLDLILRVPVINFDYMDANGFVSLSAKKMQRNFTEYKIVLQYLMDSGIVSCRRWYKPQLQPKGYKITPDYRTGDIQKVKIIESVVRKVIWSERMPTQDIVYPLFERSLSGIQVNESVLREYIDWDYEKKRNDPTLIEEKRKKIIKPDGSREWKYMPVDIVFQKQSSIMLLEEIRESKTNGIGLRGFVDAAGGRFHHAISRMKKELRNGLKLFGEKIVGVDIGCSQFFLFGRLCDVDFWDSSSKDGKVTIKDLPEKFEIDFSSTPCSGNKKRQSRMPKKSILEAIIFTLEKVSLRGETFSSSLPEVYIDNLYTDSIDYTPIQAYSSLSMLLNCSDVLNVTQLREELNKFEVFACNGNLYEDYQELVYQRTGTVIDRRQAKDSMCQTLFSSNSFYLQKGGELKRVFSRIFPALMEFIKLIKTGNKSKAPHARLPIILQAIEAEIILNRVGKRIELERPEMPLIPLHDGLFTTEANGPFLKEIMEEELFKSTGRKPTLRLEEWCLENLKYSDGGPFVTQHFKSA